MPDIESVAVEPDHCHRCGAEVGTTQWEGREHPWCPECDLVLSRHPVPAVHTVVHDDDTVLLLDEPIPQQEGVLSLPGGYTKYDEEPRVSALRELEEETSLRADPADLEFLTIYHAEFPQSSLYFITYALARSDAAGDLTPEDEGFEAAFRPVEEVFADDAPLRDSDQERIRMALER
ncbi:NUDIX hydrolase [Halolamina sp. CBA1230]|uniref:NUDIX hydrolase n=1 Tax=Halolamina sp. CBA1230 TaxID=1853690 RepID=UPI0009A18FFB|nr:NUDIX domain-containing protein [Halolamina sp. CBA1230]QKY20576.1 NUDIX hydrolase [Halolamina sp. CBA1230]